MSVLSAYCEAKGEFARPALVGLPMDIIMISSIIISYRTNTILLAYGTVCAYAAQLIPLIPYCYHQGFHYKFQVNLRDPYLKRMLAMFLPNIEKPDIKKTQAMVGPQNMTRLSFKIAVEMAMMSPELKKVAPKPPTAL